jgi:hypothetical protein
MCLARRWYFIIICRGARSCTAPCSMAYRDEPDVYMSVHYSCINYVKKVRWDRGSLRQGRDSCLCCSLAFASSRVRRSLNVSFPAAGHPRIRA